MKFVLRPSPYGSGFSEIAERLPELSHSADEQPGQWPHQQQLSNAKSAMVMQNPSCL